MLTMDAALRRVTRLPLEELWRPNGMPVGLRLRVLKSNEISQLLRENPVEFVVADVGQQLRWITPRDCYDFWKTEVKLHLAEIGSPILLDTFPNAYCYTASEWDSGDTGIPVILLERHH